MTDHHHQVRRHSHRGGGFSESSSYETHEHFERKVQRVKKKPMVQAIKTNGEMHEVRAIKVGFQGILCDNYYGDEIKQRDRKHLNVFVFSFDFNCADVEWTIKYMTLICIIVCHFCCFWVCDFSLRFYFRLMSVIVVLFT